MAMLPVGSKYFDMEDNVLDQDAADPWDTNSWDSQHKWLKDKLEEFYTVFSKRIKSLDADEYQED